MILRRLGNKSALAETIQKYFPQHSIYIELFFGAGGMFFNKPKSKFNICNDIDEDVINVFKVVKEKKAELINEIETTPVHDSIYKSYKKEKGGTDVQRAARFLYLSNYSYMGSGSLRFGADYSVKNLLSNCRLICFDDFDVKFMNTDFRNVLDKIAWRNNEEKDKAFIYADPPYLGTSGNYDSFSEKDTEDLFRLLCNCKIRFAISEFNHPLVMELSKENNLNVHVIGERNNLRNRRTEILVTNYKNHATLFDTG